MWRPAVVASKKESRNLENILSLKRKALMETEISWKASPEFFHETCVRWQIYAVVKVTHIMEIRRGWLWMKAKGNTKTKNESTIQGLSQLFSSWGYVLCCPQSKALSMQFSRWLLLATIDSFDCRNYTIPRKLST